MIIKRTINFYPNTGKLRGDGNAPLRCYIRWKGGNITINLGYNVNTNAWNSDTQRCKRNTDHDAQNIPASEINRIIGDCEELINNCFSHFEKQGATPTKDELKHLIDVRTGKIKNDISEKDKFTNVIDEFIKANSSKWEYNTYKHFRSLREQIQTFDSNCKLSDFDDKKMPERILHFFLNLGDGNNNNTIHGKIKYIKNVLKYAIQAGYIADSNFLKWRHLFKSAKRPVIFLTWEELMRIYKYDFSKNLWLDAVRDVFCFCCFTSLRYSDVANLKAHNIVNNTIRITTIKTSDTLEIELNKYSMAILTKYKGKTFKNGLILPIISNQKTNKQLKEIAKLCEINTPVTITSYKGIKREDKTVPKYELITSHVGRRTFISNAIMLGIPPEIVMKWSGHSDYKAMKPYIDIANEAKKQAMALFDKL